LASATQFCDDRPDYTQKYERFALLKVGQRISQRRAARMPRDRERAADCEGKTEEEPKYERRMRELLDTLLDRQPRIALGINPASGSRLRHLFRRVRAERYR